MPVGEVDFVVSRGRGACDAIECKWRAAALDPKALMTFRSLYPKGKTFVVTPDTRESYVRTIGAFDVQFSNLTHLRRRLEA
jgi:hypothetical protein